MSFALVMPGAHSADDRVKLKKIKDKSSFLRCGSEMPHPMGPEVFGPFGFGSVIIFLDPDPSINKQKLRKTSISAVL